MKELYTKVETAKISESVEMDVSIHWSELSSVPGYYNCLPSQSKLDLVLKEVEIISKKCDEVVSKSTSTYAKIVSADSAQANTLSFQQIALTQKADEQKEEILISKKECNLILHRVNNNSGDAKKAMECDMEIVRELIQCTAGTDTNVESVERLKKTQITGLDHF